MEIRGKIIDIIRSMYENIKSSVKYDNQLSNEFTCLLGGSPRGVSIPNFILYVCL